VNYPPESGVVGGAVGRDAEAYPLLKTVTEKQPDRITAICNFGQLCQNLEKYEEAQGAFLLLVENDPSDWRALAKTIQLHQALSQFEQRDVQREKLFDMRSVGDNESLTDKEFYCREQFSAEGEDVMVMEYFELKGDMAVRYSFVVLDETGKKKYKISLGSYDSTNDICRELGEIEKDQRLFHLDGYFAGGAHKTYGFFTNEPPYEEVRSAVIEVLAGRHQAISSMTPSENGDTEIQIGK